MPEADHDQETETVAYEELKLDTQAIQTVSDYGKVFYVSQNFPKIHETRHRPSKQIDAKTYECPTCDKICAGIAELHKHERKHLPPLVCDYCNENFYNRSLLKSHLFKHNAEIMGNSDMICSYCEMIFSNKAQVEAHRIEFHTRSNDVIYSCEFCNKTFSIKFDMLMHIRRAHRNNKKFSCKYCYKKITDEETLEEHLIEHENEEACVCLHCGKSFKGKKLLRHHIGYYHTKSGYAIANKTRSLRCKICDKAFTYPNQVRNHEINIHGVGEAAFFCTICQKGFAKQWDLQNHEKMHSDSKPFQCSECPKMFRRATHLKSHVYNVHTPATEKKEERCLICHKQFKGVESLRKHLKKVHTMTMNEMYKNAGLKYNGRDILSSKMKMMRNEADVLEEGTIEIEIIGATIEDNQ